MKTWQLQEAKNRFSEVIDLAVEKGAQIVTRHGQPVIVVLEFTEYKKLSKPKNSLVEFFAPLQGSGLKLRRKLV